MLIKQTLYLINVLTRAFERAIDWIVNVMESLCLIYGRRILMESFLEILEFVDRLLLLGKSYLVQVRKSLSYRLYFEAVTQPMRTRYRKLKKG